MTNNKIVQLMAVPAYSRNLTWLQESLQSAVELEFATLPVYLSGMWSIKNQSSEVHDLVKSVAIEEMLHLGLACNMLRSIGGMPKFVAPKYPGHLPGGVLPHLDVYLGGLNQMTLDMYMAIEEPEHPLALSETGLSETQYPTIGIFYDAIRAVFQVLSPPISTDGQIAVTLDVPNPDGSGTMIKEMLTHLSTLDDVLKAIATIKDQGEGTGNSPDSLEFGDELAHYYRFGEIRYGRKFVQIDGRWDYTGAPVPFPDCYPVSRVPAGGYPDLPASKSFNTAYLQLVTGLQNAWEGGGEKVLDAAIEIMFQLSRIAAIIVATPLPDGSGNYGPDFRPIAS